MTAPADTGAWLLTALVVVGLVYGFALSGEAPVVRRVFLRFFALIALPLTVILGVMLWGLSLVVDLDERVWQAVVAGLFIASGWLTTAIFAELARTRDKAERLRDTHKALYAEIGNTLDGLWANGESAAYGKGIVERMQADDAFIPFIPREDHTHIYDNVVSQIEVLPRVTIDPIVGYYSQMKAVAALAEDMRGSGFRRMSQDRRILMYRDYLEMRERGFAYGQYALTLIRGYSEGGETAARAAAEGFNTPGAGRNGRSRGSE